MRHNFILGSALLTLVAVAPLHAQDNAFVWRKAMAAGKTVEIKNVNGDISAVRASGSEVEVSATKHARRSNTSSVELRVVEHEDGVTICAVYPTPENADRENECEPGDGGQMNVQKNDVKVDFTVEVPAGVELVARTVNGEVEIERLASNVEAATVNGGITISTSGHASAATVNGSIVAQMGSAAWTGDLEFQTVNGSVTLDMPANLNADVRFSTLNGGIETDFPVSVSGQLSRKSMKGTIGAGGRDLRASTVNGSIRIRRAD